MMTIGLTFVGTIMFFVYFAIQPNVQYDTSKMAQWSFGLWWWTMTLAIWAGALYSAGVLI